MSIAPFQMGCVADVLKVNGVLQREGVFLLFHEDSPLSDLDYFDSLIKASGNKLGLRDFCRLVFYFGLR